MSTFTPPVVSTDPPYLPESTPVQKGLFQHFRSHQVGVNVFLLSDGTYVQDYATPENANTAVPYPWDPTDPGPPVTAYVGNGLDGPQTFTVTPYIVTCYFGGHANQVSPTEVTALTAAGYGAYISG